MRALVVDAIGLAIHIPHCELAAMDMHGTTVSHGNADSVRDRNEFAHALSGGLFVWSLAVGGTVTGLFFFQGMSRGGIGGGLGLANATRDQLPVQSPPEPCLHASRRCAPASRDARPS